MPQHPVPEYVPEGYEILSFLGSGTTANVYLSKHETFGEVALKLLRPEIIQHYVLVKMFTNEVHMTQRLKYPYIVKAFEGRSSGQSYLALEYCQKGTLDDVLKTEGIPPLEQAYKYILQIALGLAFSHDKGMLHRDVKPANVFVTEASVAKLGDFGTGVFDKEVSDTAGTAYYMAPETFRGKPASPQSDVYSLGILAYEILTGERPYVGNSAEEIIINHETQVPRHPKHTRPELSENLVRVVLKAMKVDPKRRFQSTKEFIEAFEAASGTKVSVPSKKKSNLGRGSRSSTSKQQDGAQQPIVYNKAKAQANKGNFFQRLFGRRN